jgi:hypothetical protein
MFTAIFAGLFVAPRQALPGHLLRFSSLRQRVSQYFAAQMITQEWVQPQDAEDLLFIAASDIKDPDGHVLVTAYPVLRPDGEWALLVVNKDYDNAHPLHIGFHDGEAGMDDNFAGPVTMITFGKATIHVAPGPQTGLRRSGRPAREVNRACWGQYRFHSPGSVGDDSSGKDLLACELIVRAVP